MPTIQITERHLGCPSFLKGSVRISIPVGPSYGYWFPEELLPRILSKEHLDKVFDSEDTLDIEVSQEAIDIIKDRGWTYKGDR